jgi:hypothetical protein
MDRGGEPHAGLSILIAALLSVPIHTARAFLDQLAID